MNPSLRKVKQYFKIINEHRYYDKQYVKEITTYPCGYKKGREFPPLELFSPFPDGGEWGSGSDSHAWFHCTVDVPSGEYCDPLFLSVSTDDPTEASKKAEANRWGPGNPQFIIYVDGKTRQGLDAFHTSIPLEGEGSHDIYLYAYIGSAATKSRLRIFTYRAHSDLEDLIYDIETPLMMLDFLDERGQEFAMTLDYLERTFSLIDLYEPGSDVFFDSVKKAKEYIRSEFYGKYCSEQPSTVLCIGHTHIDCAWLWTLDQTREKVQRSFATVIELMRRFPEYRFMSSQPLLYKYLKEEDPVLYDSVREMVKAGRWECEGSMWVEADCNLSSGESLVRQIIYGKRFFRDEFGKENHILWLPDVFGYSAALPQILRKSGIDWFVTSKISWNDTNTMPYETFIWRGIDGSEINTYFMTATNIDGKGNATYNGNPGAKMLAGTYRRYGQKDLTNEVMLTYGFGDGGGGPTVNHLEQIRRSSKGIPGLPNARIGSANEFLSGLEEKIKNSVRIPRWQGELYLEFHRGTYTSMAKNKKNNRQCEFLLENAEMLATVANVMAQDEYPRQELRDAWEKVLTNQFHDIIPGSSIKEVYDRSDKDYSEIIETGSAIIERAAARIANGIANEHGYIILNPHSWIGSGYVTIDGVCGYVEGIPKKGYACVGELKTTSSVIVNGRNVETELLSITFDEFWQIAKIYDKKRGRNVLLPEKRGNEIRIYADYPDDYDNWEWQEYSIDDYKVLTDYDEATVIRDGARTGIRISRPYMKSRIVQTVWLYDETARIDFETHIDWHEVHKMVKASFPVDINTDKATYEIQFGSVERPTHKNTSWDRAKFEVCAHKYADLSDGGYGVALMNNCKYGYDIHDGTMQLSLLKCGTFPNDEADQGDHDFIYSLYPHDGKLTDSDVIKEAYYLNFPMTAIKACGETDTLPSSFSAISVNCDNVVCETIKKAEESDDIIVRLYESKNIRKSAEIAFGFDVKEVKLCDLVENEIDTLSVTNNSVSVDFNGFEIITLKLIR